MRETKGTSALLTQIRKQAEQTVNFKVSSPILGRIQGTSLKLDNFDLLIPRSDYLILQSDVVLSNGSAGSTIAPENGDRVLCVPTDGGRTFVVVGKVN